MKLLELCRGAGLECPDGASDREITEIVTDSRRATAGSLFVCIRGLRTDGHAHVGEALARGASAVLTLRGEGVGLPSEIPHLTCDDTRGAGSRLFDVYYGCPSKKLKFIGVTGTNGKTSVTHMLRSVLEADTRRCGLIGTVGCESMGTFLESSNGDPNANMTTPDPAELYRMLARMVEDGVEFVLMEVTSHALALQKTAPIFFDTGIFTNLTPEHLDFHGTMEEYARAKARLLAASRISVINADSIYAKEMASAAKGRTVTCSAFGRATYRAERIVLNGPLGVDYELVSSNARMRIKCPIPGHFTVMNTLQAAACALELGIGASAVKTGLSSLMGVKGRMERVRTGSNVDPAVFIDYAHTPDALEKLLRTARDFGDRTRRVTVVFGCGGDRDRSKRPLMGAVAERYADRVILTSDNSRSEEPENIIEEIIMGMESRPTVIVDRADAIRYAICSASPGEVILLAGKGHEEYELSRNGRRSFSEREVALAALAERQRRLLGDG